MYCKNCGKEIDNDSKFCSYCGTKQSDKLTPIETQELASDNNPIAKNNSVSLSFGKSVETKIDNKDVKIDKYDESYEGDHFAGVLGIIIMLFSLIIYLTVRFENETELATYRALASVINIIYRIVVTFWVVNIAKRQNRNPGGWGVFAFFVPNLALVIIGFSKKLLRELSMPIKSNFPTNSINEVSFDDYNYNSISFKIKETKLTESFWSGERDILIIEFSDGKEGKIYSNRKDKFSLLSSPGDIHIHYKSEEAAIEGLHYYLTTKKISKKGRIN